MSTREIGTTLLFCPANRPERFEKAAAAADTAILDFEDAVSPEDKDTAREFVGEALSQDPDRFLVGSDCSRRYPRYARRYRVRSNLLPYTSFRRPDLRRR